MGRDEHEGPAPGLVLAEACSPSPCRVGTHRTTSWGTPGSPRGDSTDDTWDTEGSARTGPHSWRSARLWGRYLGRRRLWHRWAGVHGSWVGGRSIQCAQEESTWAGGTALCFPEDLVFSKTLRHFG